MDRCGWTFAWIGAECAHENQMTFAFYSTVIFFFHSLSITVERDSALMQDQLFFICILTCAISMDTNKKKVFLFVPSFRYHIIMCSRYWKCPYNVVAGSSDGTSIFTGIIYLVFFQRALWGSPHHTMCPFVVLLFLSLFLFLNYFYNKIFTSHLATDVRLTLTSRTSHTIFFWKQ